MFKLLPVRETGLNMEEHLKRAGAAVRSDPAWDCVVITDEAGGSRQGSGTGRPRAGQRPPRKKTLAGPKIPKNTKCFWV